MMRVLLGLLWIGSTLGCVIDTVPLPEDNPDPQFDVGTGTAATRLINVTSLYYSDDGASVFLVGTQDAMPGQGDVEIDAPGGKDTVKSAPNGSFGASINADLFDQILISYFEDTVLIDAVLVTLLPGSVAAARNQDDLEGILAADPPAALGEPDASGIDVTVATSTTVTISGAPGTADANIVIVITNLTLLSELQSGGREPNAVATRALTAADGSFIAVLDGQSGDELLLFAVEQALSSGGGGTPLTVFVP